MPRSRLPASPGRAKTGATTRRRRRRRRATRATKAPPRATRRWRGRSTERPTRARVAARSRPWPARTRASRSGPPRWSSPRGGGVGQPVHRRPRVRARVALLSHAALRRRAPLHDARRRGGEPLGRRVRRRARGLPLAGPGAARPQPVDGPPRLRFESREPRQRARRRGGAVPPEVRRPLRRAWARGGRARGRGRGVRHVRRRCGAARRPDRGGRDLRRPAPRVPRRDGAPPGRRRLGERPDDGRPRCAPALRPGRRARSARRRGGPRARSGERRRARHHPGCDVGGRRARRAREPRRRAACPARRRAGAGGVLRRRRGRRGPAFGAPSTRARAGRARAHHRRCAVRQASLAAVQATLAPPRRPAPRRRSTDEGAVRAAPDGVDVTVTPGTPHVLLGASEDVDVCRGRSPSLLVDDESESGLGGAGSGRWRRERRRASAHRAAAAPRWLSWPWPWLARRLPRTRRRRRRPGRRLDRRSRRAARGARLRRGRGGGRRAAGRGRRREPGGSRDARRLDAPAAAARSRSLPVVWARTRRGSSWARAPTWCTARRSPRRVPCPVTSCWRRALRRGHGPIRLRHVPSALGLAAQGDDLLGERGRRTSLTRAVWPAPPTVQAMLRRAYPPAARHGPSARSSSARPARRSRGSPATAPSSRGRRPALFSWPQAAARRLRARPPARRLTLDGGPDERGTPGRARLGPDLRLDRTIGVEGVVDLGRRVRSARVVATSDGGRCSWCGSDRPARVPASHGGRAARRVLRRRRRAHEPAPVRPLREWRGRFRGALRRRPLRRCPRRTEDRTVAPRRAGGELRPLAPRRLDGRGLRRRWRRPVHCRCPASRRPTPCTSRGPRTSTARGRAVGDGLRGRPAGITLEASARSSSPRSPLRRAGTPSSRQSRARGVEVRP